MNNERLYYIDSLRGLAALSVIGSHFIGAYILPQSFEDFFSNTILATFRNGEAAVTFFFVLSGFVLSFKYFQESSFKNFSYSEYCTARLFRIYPLFIAVLFLSVIMKKYAFTHYSTFPEQSNDILHNWDFQINIFNILKQASLSSHINSDLSLRYIPQDWTLRIELVMSIIVPFMAMLCKKNQFWFLTLMLILIVLFRLTDVFFHFTLGVFIACIFGGFRDKWARLSLIFKIAMFLVGLFLYNFNLLLSDNWYSFLNRFVINAPALGSAIILLVALCSVKAQMFLNIKFIRFTGKISYGIYLVHFMILLVLTPFVIKELNDYGLKEVYSLSLIAFLTTLFSSILLAWGLHELIEIPFINLGKKVKIVVGNIFDKVEKVYYGLLK